MLLARGVCTAPWIIPGERPFTRLPFPDRYIIKPVFEDVSIGLDSEAVITAVNIEDVEDRTRLRSEIIGKPCFAERFIEGREFNISIMDTPGGIKVMPPAEMHFLHNDGMLPIMDYKAKWAEDSPEYDMTKRSFDLEGEDELVDTLKKMTLKCWKIFGLKGYARVDFRVDTLGKPWVLEINANPCLQPESGLAAAAQETGLSYAQTIGQIISSACH
jgi:D-alanine-D-alanine ligase